MKGETALEDGQPHEQVSAHSIQKQHLPLAPTHPADLESRPVDLAGQQEDLLAGIESPEQRFKLQVEVPSPPVGVPEVQPVDAVQQSEDQEA